MASEIKLGDKVRNKYTDFAGTVTGRVEYLSGHIQFKVEAVDKHGRPVSDWIHPSELERDGPPSKRKR